MYINPEIVDRAITMTIAPERRIGLRPHLSTRYHLYVILVYTPTSIRNVFLRWDGTGNINYSIDTSYQNCVSTDPSSLLKD